MNEEKIKEIFKEAELIGTNDDPENLSYSGYEIEVYFNDEKSTSVQDIKWEVVYRDNFKKSITGKITFLIHRNSPLAHLSTLKSFNIKLKSKYDEKMDAIKMELLNVKIEGVKGSISLNDIVLVESCYFAAELIRYWKKC